MKILVIDNYDSFVYNLVHYLYTLDCEVNVVRNDKVDFKSIGIHDKILLSPGPGLPSEAGHLIKIIKDFAGLKPILGICLGHQAIAEVFGAKLLNLKKVYHGVAEKLIIKDQKDYIFNKIPSKINVGRYHSWIVDPAIPDCLTVTASDEKGRVMALKHNKFDIRGLQFHPESILTEFGMEIMRNWVNH